MRFLLNAQVGLYMALAKKINLLDIPLAFVWLVKVWIPPITLIIQVQRILWEHIVLIKPIPCCQSNNYCTCPNMALIMGGRIG